MQERLNNIMVIDDTSFIHNQFTPEFISKSNLTFEKGGKKALEKINASHPEVFVIQLMLSQMDSLEICQRIRKLYPQEQPTLIVLSNTSYRKSIHDAVLKNGADHVLFYPIDHKNLENLVSQSHFPLH